MGSTIGLIVLLSGCGVYSDVKLSMARDALRQECMGNFTNTCVSKTIDYNILLLEEAKSAWRPRWSPTCWSWARLNCWACSRAGPSATTACP